MKTAIIVLAFIALAGCAIVPIASYDAYGPYSSAPYYPSTNDYYSSGYPVAQYSYGYAYPGYYGYGYGYSRAPYSGYYGHGYQRPSYTGHSGYRHAGSYGGQGRNPGHPGHRPR